MQLQILTSFPCWPLNTATSIISAVFKPPIAKLSGVLGRAEAYLFTICCYIISYILCAASKNFNTYAGGVVLYAIGQSGVTVLNAVLISGLTSMRWRAFSYNILYLPFLIVPWVSAFIIESVVNGIGGAGESGMFAILMPVCASVIIITLAVFQSRACQTGVLIKEHLNLYGFCSRIDLGGTILLSGGFALLLIPITIAATTTSRWQTPWVDVLLALGIVALLTHFLYEKYISNHPVVPTRYFRVPAIVASVCLACIDNIGVGATHTYLYAWSTVSRGFLPRNAQFLVCTNGVMQSLTGMAIWLVIYRIRSYKWILVGGAVVRLVGYGIMVRLRTNDSSIAELFIVQLVQGLGCGIIETIVIVASQIVVPHVELAQVTSLIMLSAFLGNGIGSAIAGGIYTDTLMERLRVRLGEEVSEGRLDKLYNSITGALPDWGTPERNAVNLAYSDVMGCVPSMQLLYSVRQPMHC